MNITLVTSLNPRAVVEALRTAAKQWDAEAATISEEHGGTSQLADNLVQLKFQMAIDARATAAHLESEIITKEKST